jgi:hypothetical protein
MPFHLRLLFHWYPGRTLGQMGYPCMTRSGSRVRSGADGHSEAVVLIVEHDSNGVAKGMIADANPSAWLASESGSTIWTGHLTSWGSGRRDQAHRDHSAASGSRGTSDATVVTSPRRGGAMS